jgi:hypothetical protein
LDCAEGNPAEFNRAFRDAINESWSSSATLSNNSCKPMKCGPFTLIQQVDHSAARLLAQVVLCLI